MKHEWKKHEKHFYLPKTCPETADIPLFNFFSLSGKGNPNSACFGEYVGVLYSLAYAVKMSPKAGIAPENYREYTVYPLEGVWDLNQSAKDAQAALAGAAVAADTAAAAPKPAETPLNKDSLVFTLFIRQPHFVTPAFADLILQRTCKKKPHALLEKVQFTSLREGPCVQMMHLGSYDSEPESFALMESFCAAEGLRRKHRHHREIYISDPRRTAPEKLKTVLRFEVEPAE